MAISSLIFKLWAQKLYQIVADKIAYVVHTPICSLIVYKCPRNVREVKILAQNSKISGYVKFKVTPKVNRGQNQQKRCIAFCKSPLAINQWKLHENIFVMFWDERTNRFCDLDLILSRSLKPLKVLLLYPIEQLIRHSPHKPWFIWRPNFWLNGPRSGGTN